MGFEALVINRIHHSLKDSFKAAKKMEFLWRGADVGQRADMFTHVLHTHYSAPPSVNNNTRDAACAFDSAELGLKLRFSCAPACKCCDQGAD